MPDAPISDTRQRIVSVRTDAIQTHPRNARRGDVAKIRASLDRWGQYQPIVIQASTGYVIAGNHRLLAARDLGWAEIDAILLDVDDDAARRILLVDNKSSDDAGYEDAALAELLRDLQGDFDGTGWDQDDLDELLAEMEVEELPTEEPEDSEPGAPPADPVTCLGDVWVLGEHRLVCGDTEDVYVHDRLLEGRQPDMIFTDPPYGMNLQTDYTKVGHGGGKAYAPVHGDDRPYDARPLLGLYANVAEQFWWGADYYRDTIEPGGSWIVWDKRDNDTGMELDRLFGAAFELCWSRQPHKREIARVLWAMTHGSQREGEDAKRGLHPTQKPVDLVAWFLERYGSAGDVVADFYGGSGTTLIAAHNAGRVARLIELSPAYCDVIARRFQKHTGVVPVRIGADGTREELSFL